MKAKQIEVFTKSVEDYFLKLSSEKAQCGESFVKGAQSVLLDFTGSVGVSGASKGYVYVTASEALLGELVHLVLGERDETVDALGDMIGEVVNTICGGARNVFGNRFLVSVPIVLKGAAFLIKLPIETIIIPATWKSHEFFIGIGLET